MTRVLAAVVVAVALVAPAAGAGPGGRAEAAAGASATVGPGGWEVLPAPPLPGQADLTSVVAFGPRDAWAVGSVQEQGAVRTLTLHWNGARWTRIPSPNRSRLRNYLTGVSGSSSSDVWAVGRDVAEDGRHRALVLHWDGRRWGTVPSPDPGMVGSLLTDVVALSATDAWAVGSETVAHPLQGRTLAMRWNGVEWRVVPTPSPSEDGVGSNLLAVGASSSDEVWAVGDVDQGDFVMGTLVLRWDGADWTEVPAPSDPQGALLSGVAPRSSLDVWTVGWRQGDVARPLALRWDGDAWTETVVPVPAGEEATIADVVSGPGGIWTVGSRQGPSGTRTLTARFDGASWDLVPGADPGAVGNSLASVAAVPGAPCLWAVGQFTDGERGVPLIERYCEGG